MSFDIQHALTTLQADCDWLGLRYVRENTQRRSLRDGHPEANANHLQAGLMMEVVVDGQLAYAATSDTTHAGLKRCFERGKALCRQSAGHRLMDFDPTLRGNAKARHRGLSREPLDGASMAEIASLMRDAAAVLGNTANVLSSSVHLWLIEHTTHYVTSAGADLWQHFDMVSQTLEATGKKADVVQTRTDGGFFARSWQTGLEALRRDDLLARAEQVGREMNQLLDADDCPSGNYDLLLMPTQMMLQIHESIGHPLELDRILGDERNYAGWSFVKPEDFGTLRYGSPLMNVTFDPSRAGEFASYAYDDAGIAAQKKHLIKDGILQAGLGGSESQRRLGLPGVANVRAQSWNRAPIDRMANINLEPGESSLAEMIRSVERGVLMDANRSWSIDDYRNKFQFGCEYGQLIEDGELTRVVKNPNYRGTTVPFWQSLKAVGDGSSFATYGTPHCGKGEPNQLIRVGHASPAALFADVQVFGGAA